MTDGKDSIETFEGYSALDTLKKINNEIKAASDPKTLEALLQEKERFVEILAQDADDLAYAAFRDPLTGAYNRRFFEESARNSLDNAKRSPEYHQLCLLFLDADHFKSVNDTYGHEVGDQVLKHIVKETKSQLRKSDLLARYGGEEFIIAASDSSCKTGYMLAERIRHHMENSGIKGYEDIRLTLSIGVACTDMPWDTYEDLVSMADSALYQAKSAGRNRVIVYKGEKK